MEDNSFNFVENESIRIIINRLKENDSDVMKELLDDYTPDSILDIISYTVSADKFTSFKKLSEYYYQMNNTRRRCNTVWNSDTFIYKCRECQTDENCAICVDCYRPELHIGHSVRLVPSNRGCCDCGDESAWKKESTCERHGFHSSTSNNNNNNNSIPNYCLQIIDMLIREFQQMYSYLSNSNSSINNNEEDQNDLPLSIVKVICKLTDVLGDKLSNYIGEKIMKFSITDRNKLYITLVRLLVEGNELLERLIVSLFTNCDEFRDELSLYLAQNYQYIRTISTKYQKNTVFNLTIQLFSIDAVAHKIVSTNSMVNIVNNLLKVFEDSMVDGHIDFKHRLMKEKQYFRPLSDICCILRNKSSFLYLLENPSQILLLQKALYLTQEMGSITRCTTHVEYEDDTWTNRFSIEYYYRKSIYGPMGKHFREVPHESYHIQGYIDNLYRLINLFYQADMQWKKGIRDIQIPDYRVSKQSVSFHLPMHRSLIAILLQMSSRHAVHPSQVLSTINPLLLIDPLIRVRVLVAMIRAGIFVRNGQNVKMQSYTYFHTYEMSHNDFFLLQYVASCIPPVEFYAQLLDRCELSTWFTLDGSITKFDKVARQSETERTNVIVAEDMTSLLIGMITDRTRLASKSFEDAVRIEIIHHLAVNGHMKHGDIFQRHVELFEKVGASFDQILNDVAIFHPATSTESGKYELKLDSWAEWTPFYPHYNQQEVQMATERYQNLAKVAKKRGESIPEHSKYFESIPPTMECYKGIDQLLHCDILHSIIYSIAYNSLCGSARFSDLLLTNCIYMIKLILRVYKPASSNVHIKPSKPTVPKHMDYGFHPTDFLQNLFHPIKPNAYTLSTTQCHSLYSLLKLMFNSINFEPHHNSIKEILDHSLVKQQALNLSVDESSANSSNNHNNNSNNNNNSPRSLSLSSDQIKEIAKKRQLEIMTKFTKQQASFMEDIGDELLGLEDEETHNFGCCVICKEELNPNKSKFGYLSYVQKNSLLSHLEEITINNSNNNNDNNIELFRDIHRKSSYFLNFCSHAIHLECHKKMNEKEKVFHCPACRRLSNTLFHYSDVTISTLNHQSSSLYQCIENLNSIQTEFNIKIEGTIDSHHLQSMIASTISLIELNKRDGCIDTIPHQDLTTLQNLVKFAVNEKVNDLVSYKSILSSIFSTSERNCDFLNLDMFSNLVRMYILSEKEQLLDLKIQFIDIVKINFIASLFQSFIILKKIDSLDQLIQSINNLGKEEMNLVMPFLRQVYVFVSITEYPNHLGKSSTNTQKSKDIELEYGLMLERLQLKGFKDELLAEDAKMLKFFYNTWLVKCDPNNLHPTLWRYKEFQLANLERDYHQFYLEATKKECGSCHKKPIGLNPAYCLLCGTYLCEIDEYVPHANKCGGEFGVIFVFSKTVVLILSKTSVKISSHGIYLDQHGAEDFGFSRGNPLYLNFERVSRLKSDILSMTLQNS